MVNFALFQYLYLIAMLNQCRAKPVLVGDNRFSLSMSPAIAIVMANLLGLEANISWDWQGFEFNVMLGELKQVIVSLDSLDISLRQAASGVAISCTSDCCKKEAFSPLGEQLLGGLEWATRKVR